MTSHEDITLREPRPWSSDFREQEPLDIDRDEANPDQSDSDQWESNKKKLCVLLGSAILQLPIWGMRILNLRLQFR